MIKDLSILIADDDENDVEFLKRAFSQAEVTNPLHVASDGQFAIDYLSGAGEYADRAKYPLPGLLMLDLKMPRKTGMDVLRWVRSMPALRIIPAIIFSSSVHPQEINDAYESGANAFVTKPSGTQERTELARSIKGFWLKYNQLP